MLGFSMTAAYLGSCALCAPNLREVDVSTTQSPTATATERWFA